LTSLVNPLAIGVPADHAQQVSVTIHVQGLPMDRYVFGTSPLAELAAALHVLMEPAHHSGRQAWATAITAAIPPDLRERIAASNVLWRSSRADFLLPATPRATLTDELDDVEDLSDERWVDAALVTTSCGSVPVGPAPGLLTSAAARESALHRAASRGPLQAAFAERVLADPPGVRAWVRQLLTDCEQVFFADEWRRALPTLIADVRLKTDLAERHGLEKAMTAVSPTISVDTAGRRLVVDKLQDNTTNATGTGITFLPSLFGDPHLLIVHAPGWAPVVQYPTATPEEPPAYQLLEERLHALDHPVRMRLLRTLARGPHTTGELAGAWSLSPPEVSRHLAALKRAGVVTSHRHGRFVRYQLDLSATARLGTDIIDALLR
jgi:DNA-binding transcriptional ArsR family regulator